MSKVLEGVQESAGNAPAQADTQQHDSFADYQKTWTSEQKETWQKDGTEPPETPTAAQPVTVETPAPEKAKVEPIASVGDEDQEPEYFGTPEQQAKQKHAFAKVKRERSEFKAKYELLEKQRAERPAVAATAQPKAEPKPDALTEPALPDINDYDDPKKYQADLVKYHKDIRVWDKQEAARERQQSQAVESSREKASFWEREKASGAEKHADFDASVFSDSFTVSLPMGEVLMSMKGGAEILYALSKNPALTAELLAETDIPGDFKNYAELAAAAESDPKLARRLTEAEAIVRHEAKRILAGSGKVDPAPKPITVSQAKPPAARVDISSSGPAKDALAEANRMYDETGDHKYLVLINKLEDERDAAKRKRRG